MFPSVSKKSHDQSQLQKFLTLLHESQIHAGNDIVSFQLHTKKVHILVNYMKPQVLYLFTLALMFGNYDSNTCTVYYKSFK